MIKRKTFWMLSVACVALIILISLIHLSGGIQSAPEVTGVSAEVSDTIPAATTSEYGDGFRAGYDQGTSDGQANCSTNHSTPPAGDSEFQRGYRDGYAQSHTALCGA